jgi:uncharacterized membrane protein
MTGLSAVAILRGLLVGGLVVGFAVLAHYGSAGDPPSDLTAIAAMAPLVALVVILLWRIGSLLWPILGGFGLGALLAWNWPNLRHNVALLYFIQHVGTNLALATLFGSSLFGRREALVSLFARLAQGGAISPIKVRYTRQVTLAWTLFFLLTAVVSTVLFWKASPVTWSVFANLLSLPLVGLMFAGELLCRHHLLPPEEHSSIADSIRGYRAAMQQRSATSTKHP